MAASERDRAGQKERVDALGETDVGGGPGSDELGETYVPPPSDVDPLGATVIGDSAESAGQSGCPVSPQQGKPSAATSKKKRVTQLGDFKLVKKLGHGGMGDVFLATQLSLGRKVALKTLSRELAKNADVVNRFVREARSLAKLHHSNIVQVYAADSVKGVHYVAIEFVDGQSMQDWMDDKKKLSIGDALHVILVCAEALRQAHKQNVIHRDIKPDNILVTKKGFIKVADFGLAKVIDEDASVTQSGIGLGTPLYMAPEQARNAKHVDLRADIYALGCTLYYFLTGQLPFAGANTLELNTAKEKGAFTAARKLNTQVPKRLDLMIDKMITPDPQHRYNNCEQLIKDLTGLNLANSSLSFFEGATAAVSSSAALPLAPTTKGAQKRSAVFTTSAEDATRAQAATPSVEERTTWYVRHSDANGKPTMSKMSTAQVRTGIRVGIIDLTAKAKPGTTGDLLPLGQFPEFAWAMNNIAVKETDEERTTYMQTMFAEIDRQYQRRHRWRWLKRLVANITGVIGLIIWLTFVAAFIFGLYLAWVNREGIMETFNIG